MFILGKVIGRDFFIYFKMFGIESYIIKFRVRRGDCVLSMIRLGILFYKIWVIVIWEK